MKTSLESALDQSPVRLDFFIRDDDGGWNDERLFALLERTRRVDVPIDLAVIPAATGGALATSLQRLMAADDSRGVELIGIHQHGYAHTNHEETGRKCEFGPHRDRGLQRLDLVEGRERLRSLFGRKLDPFFTPPWNRCTVETGALLHELGYAALSRDRTATPLDALNELPISVDWSKEQRLAIEQGVDVATAISDAMSRHVREGKPIGLMLHHTEMSNQQLDILERLLKAWRRHRKARWCLMRDLVDATPLRASGTTTSAYESTRRAPLNRAAQ
jgi:hypothetical protein